jgi:hypothetical protein
MSAISGGLWPYLVVLVGFLPNEVWRLLGLVQARGLNEDSEIVVWSRAVATAILAGVIAKLIIFSSGSLAGIPLAVRVSPPSAAFLPSPRSNARCLPACLRERSYCWRVDFCPRTSRRARR